MFGVSVAPQVSAPITFTASGFVSIATTPVGGGAGRADLEADQLGFDQGGCRQAGSRRHRPRTCVPAATFTVVMLVAEQAAPAATNFTVQPLGRLPGKLVVWLAARLKALSTAVVVLDEQVEDGRRTGGGVVVVVVGVGSDPCPRRRCPALPEVPLPVAVLVRSTSTPISFDRMSRVRIELGGVLGRGAEHDGFERTVPESTRAHPA